MSFVSVLIPTYNEEKYISSCLDSLLSQDYPLGKMEVFIIDGDSKDNTIKIVNHYCQKYPYIQLIRNKKKIVPIAMNMGIKQAKGDYIIRLDAHSSFPNDYLSSLINYALKYDSDNIGGICITDVKNKTMKSLAIKEVLSHRFGVGNSLFRTGVKDPTATDTVPFGCFKRNVFSRFGLYDERLIRNQDIELNKRIKNAGGKIFLMPTISCTYFARETFSALMKNNYENGLWNILTVFFTNSFKSLSFRHFIPLLFLCSLIIPLILSLIYTPILLISILSFSLYIIILTIVSLKLTFKNKLTFHYLLLSFITLHLSYGYGSLIGICKIPLLNR